jgi:hypothetical protein
MFHSISEFFTNATYQASISLEFVRCLPFIVIEFSVMMGCVTSTDIGSALTAALLFKKSYAVE